MEKEITNLSLRKDIKEKAVEALNKGKFPGIFSLSGLVELALDELLKALKVSSVQKGVHQID